MNIPRGRYIKRFSCAFTSADVCGTFISVREVTLKIPDERCRGKTRFPERNEMLVHVDPLCINKMRILNFPLARRFRQFRTDGEGGVQRCRARRREEMETKILGRPMGSDGRMKLRGSIYQVNGCSGSDLAPPRLYQRRKSHHVCAYQSESRCCTRHKGSRQRAHAINFQRDGNVPLKRAICTWSA